jgi:hypothetical protein
MVGRARRAPSDGRPARSQARAWTAVTRRPSWPMLSLRSFSGPVGAQGPGRRPTKNEQDPQAVGRSNRRSDLDLGQKGAMAYRRPSCVVRRLIARAVVALVSTFLVTVGVSSASPLTHAGGTALCAPALGHAKEYSTVPSVIGKSVTAAMAALRTAGLGSRVHARSMTARVYRQAPVAGSRVLQGTVVSIWAGVAASP